ncbi:MAG: hypothetical protein Udaeo2_28980 [Candidatus Udaeobacter sp.]|nr:MAG: hypothetical protein Udaeo2_28980 [Candidatus Udaeobacter sp.]
MVTIHVTAERVARGNIQHVTERTVHAGPACHKGAARRCRYFNFTLCRHFGGAWKTGGCLELNTRLVRRNACLERRRYAGKMILSRQVCVGRAECQHNATSKNNRTPYGKTHVQYCVTMKGASLVDNSYRTNRKIVSPQTFGIWPYAHVQIRHICPRRW